MMSRVPGIRLVSGAALGAAVLLFLAGSAAAEPKYVGVKDCARCHKKELIGDQYSAWKESQHAKALATLQSEEALKIAEKKGLATKPHEADECLRCHATGHGLEPAQLHKAPLALSDGVQCESCHGAGSDYRKKKVMADREKSIAAGMLEPGKDEAICTGCHNQDSPTWDPAKGFDFEAGKQEIDHPIPEDVKGRYLELEKAAREKAKQR